MRLVYSAPSELFSSRGRRMVRGIWTRLILLIATLACSLPALALGVASPGNDFVMRFARMWSRIMLRTVGAEVIYDGLEQVATGDPRIFIANHQSYVDIWALIRVLPLTARFVAKQELRRVPVLGWAMAKSDFVFVDRAHRDRAIQSLQEASRKIREGRSVVLFAEGTRGRTGRLQPFKKGPFYLALGAGVPIVPVAISGSGKVMGVGSFRVRPGIVQVHFLEPIEVEPHLPNDVAGLQTRVHDIIREQLEPAAASSS